MCLKTKNIRKYFEKLIVLITTQIFIITSLILPADLYSLSQKENALAPALATNGKLAAPAGRLGPVEKTLTVGVNAVFASRNAGIDSLIQEYKRKIAKKEAVIASSFDEQVAIKRAIEELLREGKHPNVKVHTNIKELIKSGSVEAYVEVLKRAFSALGYAIGFVKFQLKEGSCESPERIGNEEHYVAIHQEIAGTYGNDFVGYMKMIWETIVNRLQLKDDPIIIISDGGTKDRIFRVMEFGLPWQGMIDMFGRPLYTWVLIDALAILAQHPDGGKGRTFGFASDNKLTAGNITVGNKPLAELPEDADFLFFGEPIQILDEDDIKALNDLKEKEELTEGELRDRLGSRLDTIYKLIEDESLEQLGMEAVEEDGRLAKGGFVEKADKLQLIRLALKHNGILLKNAFIFSWKNKMNDGILKEFGKPSAYGGDKAPLREKYPFSFFYTIGQSPQFSMDKSSDSWVAQYWKDLILKAQKGNKKITVGGRVIEDDKLRDFNLDRLMELDKEIGDIVKKKNVTEGGVQELIERKTKEIFGDLEPDILIKDWISLKQAADNVMRGKKIYVANLGSREKGTVWMDGGYHRSILDMLNYFAFKEEGRLEANLPSTRVKSVDSEVGPDTNIVFNSGSREETRNLDKADVFLYNVSISGRGTLRLGKGVKLVNVNIVVEEGEVLEIKEGTGWENGEIIGIEKSSGNKTALIGENCYVYNYFPGNDESKGEIKIQDNFVWGTAVQEVEGNVKEASSGSPMLEADGKMRDSKKAGDVTARDNRLFGRTAKEARENINADAVLKRKDDLLARIADTKKASQAKKTGSVASHIAKTIIPSIVNVYGLINSTMNEGPLSAANMAKALEENTDFRTALSKFVEKKLRLARLGIFSDEYREAINGLNPLRAEIEEIINKESDGTKNALLSKALAIAESIITSNLFDPFYNPLDPPSLLFNGALLTGNPKVQFVAYLPDRTGSFSLIPLIDFKREGVYPAGGIRIKPPGKYDMNDIWREVYNLADSMDFKDKWSGIVSAGSKWELVLAEGYGDDTEVLKRMATAAVGLVGFGLFPYNIAGPDVNSGPKQIQPTVDAVQLRYRQHVEFEMKLTEAVLTGKINGKEIPKDGETEIVLEGDETIKISNKALLASHSAFWDNPPEQAEKGGYDIASLSAKAADSDEKFIRLYDTDDPAFKEYQLILSILEENLGTLFLRDPYIYAMREQALKGIRDGVITTLSIPEGIRVIFNKIIGVAIGGGAKENGSLVAYEGLADITARGVVRALTHVDKFLREKGVIKGEKTSVIIRGAGSVGGGAAALLIDLGYKVVAISDENGAVYKESGFTKEDIEKLKAAREKYGVREYVVKALEGEPSVETFKSPNEILWKEADILLPAALGPTVTRENVDKFNVKAIVPGENNAIESIEAERLLHNRGILAFEGSTVNYGTAYVVCAKEAEVKHRLSVDEINKKIDALIRGSIEEVESREDDLVPIMLALQDKNTTPNDIHREVVGEIRALMEEVYFDRDGKYKDKIDAVIRWIRETGSYMPYHAARSYAAMEIARGDLILGYRLAGIIEPKTQEARVRVFTQARRAAVQTARDLAELIKRNNAKGKLSVIASPTSETPEPIYEELIRMHREEGLDLSRVIFFAFDEYLGLPNNHLQRYSNYPYFKRLRKETNISAINILNADADDIQAELARYEAAIKEAGGFDAVIMPTGENSHYAFKEPAYVINDIDFLRRLKEKPEEVNRIKEKFNQFELDIHENNLLEVVGLIAQLFGEDGKSPAYIYISEKMGNRFFDSHWRLCDTLNANLYRLYGGKIRLYKTSFFETGAQDVYLTPSTREANARFFEGDVSKVPERAITTNPLKFIRNDTLVIGIVTGSSKKDALYNSLSNEISPANPVGRFYRGVPGITIYTDLEAAAL